VSTHDSCSYNPWCLQKLLTCSRPLWRQVHSLLLLGLLGLLVDECTYTVYACLYVLGLKTSVLPTLFVCTADGED
jgi:hypothetical protein